MKVRVDTTKYQFSHGKQPRGYGNWMFHILTAKGVLPSASTGPMSYSDAKCEAMAKAKAEGAIVVEVAP